MINITHIVLTRFNHFHVGSTDVKLSYINILKTGYDCKLEHSLFLYSSKRVGLHRNNSYWIINIEIIGAISQNSCSEKLIN